MADYAAAATELKSRLSAKAQKAINLDAFFEGVRTAVFAEVEKANSALANQTVPLIEFAGGWPSGNSIELIFADVSCLVTMNRANPREPKPSTLSALINAENGDKPITFLILEDQYPVQAQRVSLAPQVEAKLTTAEVAETIVFELISSTP